MAKRMRTEGLGMVSVREILRLREQGLSGNRIAQSVNVSRSVVQNYLRLATVSGLTYEQACAIGDSEALKMLGKGERQRRADVIVPEWEKVAKELLRKEVTLSILWEEYRGKNHAGYSYSNFCVLFRDWQKDAKISMRQVYKAGEKSLVDYAGMTLPLTDPVTGVMVAAQIFVMALGASNLTYAEAQVGQDIKSWLCGHERAFEYFGGVPELVIPDNLKSGVKLPCRYEPELNRSYLEFSEHYDFAIIPARVRKPQDKAKVEEAVQNVERRILAPLRDRTFYSIAEMNVAIKEKLEEVNLRPMKTYGGLSRWELFRQIEKDALKPLPSTRFALGSWKIARVSIDYHIEIARHYYSVSCELRGEKVDVRFTEKMVVVFHNGKSVAQHVRSYVPYQHTTVKEHMPPSHQYMRDWSPSRLVNWATTIGKQTARQVDTLLNSRRHPEQAYRSCLGLLRLADKFGKERLEAACTKANSFGMASFKSVQNILVNNQDKLPPSSPEHNPISHSNLRGGNYFH